MSADVTSKEIGDALGITERSVNRRASADDWIFTTHKARGFERRLYPVGLLPAEIRTRVTVWLANRDAASAAVLAAGTAEAARARLAADAGARGVDSAREEGLARFAALPEAQRQRAAIKAELVGYFDTYVRNSGLPRYRALALFVEQYNKRILEVPAPVRAAWPTVSKRSIENWEAQLGKAGLASLAGKYGAHRKGKGAIDTDDALRDFILAMLTDFPHVSVKLIMRGIRARFPARPAPDIRSVQRWVAAWKRDNKQLFEAVKNPDGWRSKFKAAGGNAAAGIERLNQRWEMDGTKGDLILADGQRHTITGVIDVYSRRLHLFVSRTSSTAAVLSCFRWALLNWGVLEQLGTDNGSDFVSHQIARVVEGLGIDHDTAPPYTPEHKPFIERAFGTFCRDLVEMLPGYAGHNVADAQAIRSRQSFAQRMMREGGEKIELRMSAAELQEFCDRWTETIYACDPHSGLNGETPFQRAAAWPHPVRRIENERALDVLLLPAPDGDGARTIGKKGIRVDNGWFDAPELGGREGEDVRVLYDDGDIGAIYVFALDGAFIAKAICPERGDLGISRRELAARRQAHQKAAIRDGKAALRAAARGAKTHTIVRDILAERAGEAAKVVAFPQASIPHTTPDLDEAALALQPPAHLREEPASEALLALEARIAAELATPAPAERIDPAQAALEAEFAAPSNVVVLETDLTRFKRALALREQVDRGEAIPAADQKWLIGYIETSEFKGRFALYSDFGDAALEA